MRHLNYNHLLYFWTVVREGGIAPAAAALHVTPQTVSGQIKLLEDQLQGALFEKQGRRLAPTELGRLAFDYAQEIFPRGLELAALLRGARGRGRRPVLIGISDAVPKLLTWRMLSPLLGEQEHFRIVCHEGPLEALLADLAAHRLDLVLSTSGVPAESGIKAFSHLLGESELGFFATGALARKLRRGFPRSLDGAPVLLPTDRSAARRILDGWFEAQGMQPDVVGEFDDSALIKTFAQQGLGAFAAPIAIERELVTQFELAPIGRVAELVARYYVISTERRIKHPAVAMITERARAALFGR
ncbi:MAG: transcriptional activator NhaR [Pseudomonadota bacterium]|jgi:LysR family transcriptional activator of nhaA|nr:transcriptional activator NhaR [Gammaproteobacteria bacterium]